MIFGGMLLDMTGRMLCRVPSPGPGRVLARVEAATKLRGEIVEWRRVDFYPVLHCSDGPRVFALSGDLIGQVEEEYGGTLAALRISWSDRPGPLRDVAYPARYAIHRPLVTGWPVPALNREDRPTTAWTSLPRTAQGLLPTVVTGRVRDDGRVAMDLPPEIRHNLPTDLRNWNPAPEEVSFERVTPLRDLPPGLSFPAGVRVAYIGDQIVDATGLAL